MPRFQKDGKCPNLFRESHTGVYYFRKYLTGVGEVQRSLKETNRYKAILNMNRVLLDLQQFKKRESQPTIDEVILELYEIYQMQAKATYENFEYYCRCYILPHFTGMRVGQVGREWTLFKAEVKRKKPGKSLLHVRRHVSRILSHCVERGYLDSFPKLKLDPAERISRKPRSYDRDEVKEVLYGAPRGQEHRFKRGTLEKQRLQLKLTLFSGLRPPQEIRHLKWEYIDFENALITVPAEIAKTREERIVPVDRELLSELKQWKLRSKSSYVFPKRGNPDLPSTATDKTWQRMKRVFGFEGKRYWFRHSHATTAIAEGVPAKVVGKNMGTSERMLNRVYVKPRLEHHRLQASRVKEHYEGKE